MKILLAITITGLLAAYQEPPIEGEVSAFDHLDADANGLITRDEVKFIPKMYEEYEQIDADASGTLDEAEFSAFEIVEVE